VIYVALPFYDSFSELESTLSSKERMLHESVGAIRNKGMHQNRQREMETEAARLRAQLLDPTDTNLAQSQLENIVRVLAEENGVSISRSTPLQERNSGERYTKVTLQITIQSGMLELANFLHALSMHPKFLTVEEFYINAFNVRNNIRLNPRMNISGFIRPSET
jgi:CHAT domain-containing protein